MAKAIQHRQVSITLELDEDEAILVRDLVSSVGGHASSRRGLADNIKQALSEAGIYESDMDDMDPNRAVIYFNAPIKTFI